MAEKKKKKGMNINAVKGAIASPKTPPALKAALKKKYASQL